ncbi:MAG: 3-keto-5-aminohexanoate cleavage protein [Pseudomonadota bacterium]
MASSHNLPVWLEVSLNGGSGQKHQPNIPIRPEDIVEEALSCVAAGAAIVHLHAYDENGRPVEDADIYSRIIEGIRAQSDAIVYPTLALAGDAESRFAPVRKLAERGLLEMGVIDPGSVNITHETQIANDRTGLVYANPDTHIREGLRLAEADEWRPAFAIYEPGFARLGSAWSRRFPALKRPVYRLMLSEHLLFGLSPSLANLEFYARHLAEVAPDMPWMISGLDADIDSIVEPALDMGAHVRTGLEDAPLGSPDTNVQLVERAMQKIRQSGRPLASPDEIRNHA